MLGMLLAQILVPSKHPASLAVARMKRASGRLLKPTNEYDLGVAVDRRANLGPDPFDAGGNGAWQGLPSRVLLLVARVFFLSARLTGKCPLAIPWFVLSRDSPCLYHVHSMPRVSRDELRVPNVSAWCSGRTKTPSRCCNSTRPC